MSYKAIWRGDEPLMNAGAAALSEFLGDEARAVGIRKDPDAPANDGETNGAAHSAWMLEAYFEEKPDLQALTKIFALIDEAWREADPGIVEEVPERDWVAHALAGLGVVRAGRFVLYGVHDADKLPDGDDIIPIRIDANEAFGTGHHPTTAGCLTLLDRFAGIAPRKALDLGCGSAVLAIAAAKLWRRAVLASDIDPRSVEIAAENIELNDVDEYVSHVCAAGFDHELINESAPFDFVFANILAGPLKELAAPMAKHVGKNGRVMLAGLMVEQADGVIDAYETNGFRLLNRLDDPVWPVLLFVKTGD